MGSDSIDYGHVTRPANISLPAGQSGYAQHTDYNAQGRKTKTIAHDGRVSFYTYNGKGRVIREATYPASYQSATTAPPLSKAESVTSTQWHATWNLPLKTAQAYLITSYRYDERGNLLELIENPTTDATGAKGFNATPSGDAHSTQWTYGANNLPVMILEFAAGNETGGWAMNYNATGDLIKITHLTTGAFATMSQYDAQGRILEGVTEGGIPVSVTYDARGHVTSITREGKRMTFVYDARGLFTQANFPTGDVITLSYDSNGRFIEAFHNGVAISSLLSSQRSAPSPALFSRLFFHGREWLGKVPSSLFSAAWAGVLTNPIRPITPSFDPTMGMLPMSAADNATRTFEESLARACQCDPFEGYFKPTLTMGSYTHLAMGGHLWPMYSDQSYFTTPVNQGFVDIAVAAAKTRIGGETPGNTRTSYRAELPYPVGMAKDPTSAGVMRPTNKVLIIVQRTPCDPVYTPNEIITMFPIIDFK